MSKFFLV
ncbi:hypothetical protein RDI58_016824 [Solanum bulbocastanum]